MKYAKRGGVKVLAEPFADVHELSKAAGKDGRLTVNIAVGFDELVGNGLESLNDYADERILGDGIRGSLADINYGIAGCVKGNSNQCSGLLIIEVNADVGDVIDENLDDEAESRLGDEE